ncbi:MAG: MFS transporter [Chloroflexota bacterium]
MVLLLPGGCCAICHSRRSGNGLIGWERPFTISLLSLNIALLNSGDVSSAGGFANLTTNEPTNTGWLYAVAAVSFALFIWIERQIANSPQHPPHSSLPATLFSFLAAPPLIDLTLFRRRNFSPAILINFLVGGVLIIAMVNVPLVINVLEYDVETAALTSGYLLSGMTGAMAVASYLGGRFTERLSYRLPTLLGLVLCIVGFALMGSSWVVGTPYSEMAWQLVILGAGFGLVIAPVGTAVINSAPDTNAASPPASSSFCA